MLLWRGIYPINGPPGDPQLRKDAPRNPSEFIAGSPAEPKISCPELNSFLSLRQASGLTSQVRFARTSHETEATLLKLVIRYRDKVIKASQTLSPPAAASLCTNIRALA